MEHLLAALSMAFAMGWEILWALVLGFALSGVVQAAVTKGEMARLLPDSRPRTILVASALGAASSSCSYAAVALARSIVRKGGDFTAAMAFQFASTTLVLELGVILAVLMGWQFTAAESVGGPAMIAVLVLLLRTALRPPLSRRRGRRRSAASPGGWKGTPAWTCRCRAARCCPGPCRGAASRRSATSASWTGRACGPTSRSGC